MAEEQWKKIPGYAGWYDVSDLGRVRSWRKGRWLGRRTTPKLLKISTHKKGYLQVGLSVNGSSVTHKVHYLVLLSFVGPRPEGLDTDHWDSNRANNRLDNLRYLSHLDNIKRSKILRGTERCNSKLQEADVLIIRERYRKGELYVQIALDYAVTAYHISSIVRGKKWGWLEPNTVVKQSNVIRGQKTSSAKLRDADIVSIRARYSNGDLQKNIAKDYGVTQAAISSIIHGRTWKHIQ
jgi:hypothetical protein